MRTAGYSPVVWSALLMVGTGLGLMRTRTAGVEGGGREARLD